MLAFLLSDIKATLVSWHVSLLRYELERLGVASEARHRPTGHRVGDAKVSSAQ